MVHLPRSILTAVVFLALFLGTARAEMVAVLKPTTGQAFLFTYGDRCFAIVPDHVRMRDDTPFPLITLRSLSPPSEGRGKIVYSEPAFDLALAEVSGGIVKSCGKPWRDFPNNVKPLLQSADQGSATRLTASGALSRSAVQVIGVTGTQIDIDMLDGDTFAGMSGAFIFVNGVPVAMMTAAKTSGGKVDAVALRADTIRALLDTTVSERGSECTIFAKSVVCN